MKRITLFLLALYCVSAFAQKPIRIYSTYAENYAADQLHEWLEKGGCKTVMGGKSTGKTIYVGLPNAMQGKYQSLIDSLHDDGFFIYGDGKNVVLYGAGKKGTLYAVYAYLEQLGYRLYTPDAMVVPDLSKGIPLSALNYHIIENPAFPHRDVQYYYPNQSRLYADWHHLQNKTDRNRLFGMFVHTFDKLVPPSVYYDEHPEWYSFNNGRRMRDGQLCLSNPEVLEVLCQRLADTMQRRQSAQVWSVSPNDNYNACECADCRRMDSVYGGRSGTLVWFINQVASRFPDKTISTLAYQYTRQAPTCDIRPLSNVQIMLCPIEVGREQPIASMSGEGSFRNDMAAWSRITDNIFLWDYVVQFRNFWNPFPNLHVIQANLQFFKENGARIIFEQASGAENVTSWMDIRCYMIAKLMWNPYVDIDSVMTDFYQGYYGKAGRYVKTLVDTMTASLIASGRRLDIYGFSIDGAEGYLAPSRMDYYKTLMQQAYSVADSIARERLRFFEMALDFADIELKANTLHGNLDEHDLTPKVDNLVASLNHYGVGCMMEMGITPDEYGKTMHHWCENTFSRTIGLGRSITLQHPATAPYNTASLTDGVCGLLDYRHQWLGFWGDTLDAVVDLGEPQTIHEISVDFYYYPLSWIFLPQRVRFAVSHDGQQWQWVYSDQPSYDGKLALPEVYTCKAACYPIEGLPEAQYRYVRVVGEPLPEIPIWHRAAGQKPWIFTDEIIIR